MKFANTGRPSFCPVYGLARALCETLSARSGRASVIGKSTAAASRTRLQTAIRQITREILTRRHLSSLRAQNDKLEKALLQVDGLIMLGFVELCTPHPVHTLVVGPAEDHGRTEPNVEVAQIFQSLD